MDSRWRWCCECASDDATQVFAAPYAVLGWRVESIEEIAAKLATAGVAPLRFPEMEHDAQGIWTSPSSARVLWFLDPDGNTLSVTELGPGAALSYPVDSTGNHQGSGENDSRRRPCENNATLRNGAATLLLSNTKT